MKKNAAYAIGATLLAFAAEAALNAGSGLDAFNRTISATTRSSAVFSPLSFEIDCVVFSEAFGALTRAKIAETMGALNGLETVYQPVYETLAKGDGAYPFRSARGFCLPEERKAHPAYRKWMQDAFAAEAFDMAFRKGAECWFRARMDGAFEDFALPDNVAAAGCYSYFDLVHFTCPWKESFPSNCVIETEFASSNGSVRKVKALANAKASDIWKRKTHVVLRLPLACESWLFVLMPNEGISLRDIRPELSSKTLPEITSSITSITDPSITHQITSVTIPTMDIVTEANLKLAFGYFRFPMTGMDRLQQDISPRHFRQQFRFQLNEKGCAAAAESPTLQPTGESIALNRPFLFFVYHAPTAAIPAVGLFDTP